MERNDFYLHFSPGRLNSQRLKQTPVITLVGENPNPESVCAAGGCPEDHGTSDCRQGAGLKKFLGFTSVGLGPLQKCSGLRKDYIGIKGSLT